jgi:hypothetical protein
MVQKLYRKQGRTAAAAISRVVQDRRGTVHTLGALEASAVCGFRRRGSLRSNSFFGRLGTIVEEPGQQSQSREENRGVLHFASSKQTRGLRTNEVMKWLG